MRWESDANAFLPFPAQTGPWKGANQAVAKLGKPFNSPGHNTPDVSAIATYILHPDGGGISLLYYARQLLNDNGLFHSRLGLLGIFLWFVHTSLV